MSEATGGAADRPTCPIRKRFVAADEAIGSHVNRKCGRPLLTVDDLAARVCSVCRVGAETPGEQYATMIDRARAMGCIRVLSVPPYLMLALLSGRILLPAGYIPDGAGLMGVTVRGDTNPPMIEIAFVHIDLPTGNWMRARSGVEDYHLVAGGKTAYELLVNPGPS